MENVALGRLPSSIVVRYFASLWLMSLAVNFYLRSLRLSWRVPLNHLVFHRAPEQ